MRDERGYRNGESPLRGSLRSRPVSRILSWMTISLGRRFSRRLERRTRLLGGQRRRSLLRLAPDGVWLAIASPRCWWALTPPFHPYPRRLRRVVLASGGFLSVPLSIGFRRLGFPQRPALRCPDFPRTGLRRPAVTRPARPIVARPFGRSRPGAGSRTPDSTRSRTTAGRTRRTPGIRGSPRA
jgi:hypothetical protein